MSDDSGNAATFWLEVRDGCVAAVSYRATSCTTLLGVCEHLCDLATALDVAGVMMLGPDQLLAMHAEIPPAKHSSVALAVTALHSAARNAA